MRLKYLASNKHKGDEMNEHIMVPTYLAEKILNMIQDETQQEWVSSCFDICRKVPVDLIEGTTKGEVIESLNLTFVYDTALPQGWFDEFFDEMKINPLQYFVWDCDTSTPYPITATAKILLESFNNRGQGHE